jgi:hypothetical protein
MLDGFFLSPFLFLANLPEIQELLEMLLILLINVMFEVSWHPGLIIGEVMHVTQFQKINFNVGV